MTNQKSIVGSVFKHGVFIVACLLCIIPMLTVISISLSNEGQIAKNGYSSSSE